MTAAVDPTAPARVGLLAPADGVVAVGTALAHGVRRASRAPVALVLVTGAATPVGWSVPGSVPARRLAASLLLRDVPARAVGRLAVVALDPEPAIALVQAQRAAVAADGAPVVVAVGGPYDDFAAALLVGAEPRVVVLPTSVPDVLVRLAGAAEATTVVRADIGAAERALAGWGLPALAPLRRLGAELGRIA